MGLWVPQLRLPLFRHPSYWAFCTMRDLALFGSSVECQELARTPSDASRQQLGRIWEVYPQPDQQPPLRHGLPITQHPTVQRTRAGKTALIARPPYICTWTLQLSPSLSFYLPLSRSLSLCLPFCFSLFLCLCVSCRPTYVHAHTLMQMQMHTHIHLVPKSSEGVAFGIRDIESCVLRPRSEQSSWSLWNWPSY